jgi:concentrative nucleoside transporter, CNT family
MELKFISLLGLVSMLALAWGCSAHRRLFPWRAVAWGLGLQFTFAVLILKTPAGKALFHYAERAVNHLSSFADEGARMVFGPLADVDLMAGVFGPQNAFVFVVSVTATIIVVSTLSSLLYHWGILQRIVQGMAWLMRRVLRTSGSETLAAAANVFVGQTEAPLVIRPYLTRMTRSELMALMVGGMATVAGGVAIVYVSWGVDAGHLLAASIMSAPAALMIAKIMQPETEKSETADASVPPRMEKTTANGIDALCRGASEGMMLSINVMAMLIAFVAVVALANFLLGSVQEWFNIARPVTLQTILGWVNSPFAWLMGVPAKDCLQVGEVLGERIVLNEFIGYLSLTGGKETLDPRSFTLATYALCGFANFASIAIQIGGIGSLAPERRGDLARLGVRAMIGGVLTCYLTATVAGIFI